MVGARGMGDGVSDTFSFRTRRGMVGVRGMGEGDIFSSRIRTLTMGLGCCSDFLFRVMVMYGDGDISPWW